jgi:hypothetical protein
MLIAHGSIALALGMPLFPAAGATVEWVGPSGDWNTTNNWSSGALPGPDDDVVIDRLGEITVTHSSGAHGVRSIQSQEAFVLSGGSLSVSSTVHIGNSLVMTGGALRGGVVTTTNSARLFVAGDGGARSQLDGVTINGEVDLTSYNAHVTVVNGLTLNGTMYVGGQTPPYYPASVRFAGSQTLAGQGTVVFQVSDYNQFGIYPQGAALTIGPDITLRAGNGLIMGIDGAFNVSLLNYGTIVAESGSFYADIQNFTNRGSLMANGGTLDIRGLRGNIGNAAVTHGGHLLLDGSKLICACFSLATELVQQGLSLAVTNFLAIT